MKMLQKPKILLFLLVSVLSRAESISIKDFSREWTFEYSVQRTIDYTFGRNNKLVYDDSTARPERNVNYTINYEYFNADGIVYHKQCRIHVISEAPDIETLGIDYFMVRSHHGKKVIFYYMDDINENRKDGFMESKYTHGLMDMETCKYKKYERYVKQRFDSDQMELYLSMNPSFTQHDDGSYGVFTYDRNLCKAARCRKFVDKSGTLKNDVVPYLPKEYSLKDIQMYPTASPDHYFAVAVDKYSMPRSSSQPSNDTTEQNYELSLLYASPDGKVEDLQHIPSNEKNIHHVDFSNGYLSICWTNSIIINCKQYNSKKTKILDENIEMPYEPKTLRIANLQSGGLILLTRQDKSEIDKNSTVYHLRKVKFENELGPIVELEDFNLPEDKKWKLTKDTNLSNEDGENVCVSIVLVREYPDDKSTEYIKKRLLRKCLKVKYLDPSVGPYIID